MRGLDSTDGYGRAKIGGFDGGRAVLRIRPEFGMEGLAYHVAEGAMAGGVSVHP